MQHILVFQPDYEDIPEKVIEVDEYNPLGHAGEVAIWTERYSHAPSRTHRRYLRVMSLSEYIDQTAEGA